MIETLQGFRFLFILLIFFSHLTWNNIGNFEFGGDCGVSFFFILSGFVLSVGYGKRIEQKHFSHKQLIAKQLIKLYPLHIMTMIVVILLDLRIGYSTEFDKIAANIFLLQSWIPNEGYSFSCNGVSWFLSDIVFFYLLFPYLFIKIQKSSRRSITLFTALLLVIYFVVAYSVPSENVNSILYVFPLTRTIDFAIGILIYRLYMSQYTTDLSRWLNKKSVVSKSLFEIIFLIALILTYFIYIHINQRLHSAALFWCVIPFFIYFFAITDKGGGIITRMLHSDRLIWHRGG
ncbi:MAG: acyltransferase [Prevotella sp.]|nr:acyltransferase [Prevotella sp.]